MRRRHGFTLHGRFRWERHNSGLLIRKGIAPNGICSTAINNLLDREFNAGSQVTTWYVGLIDAAGFTGVSEDDTMASHPGWTEITDYDEGVRQEYNPGAAAGQFLANPDPMEFTATAIIVVHGFFVASDDTIGETSSELWSTAILASDQTMPVGEALKLFYELEAASG